MTKEIDRLNHAIELENVAVLAYDLGAQSGMLNETAIKTAQTFKKHHQEHIGKLREALDALGGKVQSHTKDELMKQIPIDSLKSQEDVLHFAIKLEKIATVAYLTAVGDFEDTKLAQAAASIMGDEAMHWAALRNALGLAPVHISFIPFSADEVED